MLNIVNAGHAETKLSHTTKKYFNLICFMSPCEICNKDGFDGAPKTVKIGPTA